MNSSGSSEITGASLKRSGTAWANPNNSAATNTRTGSQFPRFSAARARRRRGNSVADIVLYGYLHVAHEAGYELPVAVRAWLQRVEAKPRFMNDFEPYPPNARPGAGRSLYDA